MEMLYRTVALAHIQLVGAGNGPDQIRLSLPGRFYNVVHLRQQGRQGGRQRATGAMRIACLDSSARQLDEAVAIVQDIDGVVSGEVSALQEDPALTGIVHQPAQLFGSAAHLLE